MQLLCRFFLYICHTNKLRMRKFLLSFRYAANGIRLVFGHERNMNIHLLISAAVVICGFIFDISINEWLVCIACMALVISLELINSAIERLVNLVSPGQNRIAGEVKDIAAGAVLVASVLSAIIGLIIFIPKGVSMIIS